MTYYIITFGCQMNTADSERLASYYEARGFKRAKNEKEADVVVINTCMVRQKAEDRIYGLVNNLSRPTLRAGRQARPKIIVTGCFVGAMEREPSKRMKRYAKERMPGVDEYLPMDEVGFEYLPKRDDKKIASLPISNGCNNMCSYCIVPFSRGREVSRPFNEIIKEAESLAKAGYEEVTLLGQNVNSYGADLVLAGRNTYKCSDQLKVKPIMVKSMGRSRIPTLFPYLLEEVSRLPFAKVNFISSNPWDFSNELIDVIAKHKNINREIHLPVQSGDNDILKKMNRWYTREEYLDLIKKIKAKISDAGFTTDIIVGFPGETEEQFQNTVDLCRRVNFNIAYIARYSPRPGTAAEKMEDSVPWEEKKRRFQVLDRLVNRKIK